MAKATTSYRVKGKRVYRDFSQAELNIQYDARGTAPDGQYYRDLQKTESERVRAEFECRLDVPYGDTPEEILDIFPATQPGSPVVYFIHGGYWRSSSQRHLDLYAATFVPAGAAYVSVNYALAPGATIDEIVRQCRAGLEWVWRNASDFNGDPDRIHVNGRSAGGHLTGMMLATDWASRGLPADTLKGATAVSGMYDLEPVRLSNANDWARLDKQAAFRNSPIHHIPPVGCPLLLAWGGTETEEFKRQSRDFGVAWASRGYPVRTMELADKHHFATMPDLLDPQGELSRAVLEQMKL
ncbi:MAG: alpha/beta hydrolase [Alphaproteobacteria bacterium]